MKLTLSWYVYYNTFYWTQYKSDLGYYNPSRIRLGTYDDSGTTRIRIEIANDGSYWSSYFVSAIDHNGVASNYGGWSYAVGAFPSETTSVVTVTEHSGFVYSNAGNIGIGTATPGSKVDIAGPTDSYSSGIGFSPWGPGARNYRTYISSSGSFVFNDATAGASRFSIDSSGNLGVGTTTPSHKLSVNGGVRAKEVIVDTGWSDYVFADDYRLAPLAEVEAHIKSEKHLPGIPSAKDVAEQGVSLGEMQAKLLAKIEELTLHQIALEKRLRQLEQRNNAPE